MQNLVHAIIAVGCVGTAMILGSLLWNVSHIRGETKEEARIQALVAYEEELAYRRWSVRQGGVYVRVTEDTPPSPYLAGMPGRDVFTRGGLHLTLANPATMGRQAHGDDAARIETVISRLTSLTPLRQDNGPDPWEEEALNAFEQGETEVSVVEQLNGGEYLRLIKPLVMEDECLGCHAAQGYTPGAIRGGISVAIPMAPLRAMERSSSLNLAAAHALLWMVGIGALFAGGRVMLRSERARAAAEDDIRRHTEELEDSNRLKDLFTDIMRHDLLNPTGIIQCYADFIAEREVDQRTKDFVGKIRMTAGRLRNMIEEASHFTHLQNTDEIECGDLDLDGILRESIQDIRERRDGAWPAIVYEGGKRLPVRANPLLSSVFSNLLSNAVKYAASGRKVIVHVTDEDPSWTVSVTDFGDGIPAEDRERIFCRFERLQKGGVQGSGLGLAIVRHLVALHGGGIWVEENPAGGAVFKVRLPKEGPAAGSAAARARFALAEAV